MHAVACCGNLQNIFRFSSSRMRLPKTRFVMPLLPVLTGFGLRVDGIFESVIAVRDSYVVNSESKLPALSKVKDTLVRSSPVGAQIGFILIMPDQPPATFEKTRCRKLDVRQDLRESTDIKRPGWL